MAVESTEKLLVPLGQGALIGDLIRKYSIKCHSSWQPIGYFINSTAENYGFSNGSMSNYLQLLTGKIVSHGDSETPRNGSVQVLDFTWDGKSFVNGQLELVGVSRGVGDTVKVAILYTYGHRTESQNRELLRKIADNDGEGFYAVSSSHSNMHNVKYKIEPEDSVHEWLVINANMNSVRNVVDQLVSTLTSLNL